MFVGFIAVSYTLLKGCGWAGWIPACLPGSWCGYAAGAREDVGSDGGTGQAGSLQRMVGLETDISRSCNPYGRKQEAFWGLRGEIPHRPRNYCNPLALKSGLEGRFCPLWMERARACLFSFFFRYSAQPSRADFLYSKLI